MAPVTTHDLDLVFSLAPENIARILTWLEKADAISGWSRTVGSIQTKATSLLGVI
jgi:hypothetical protein